MSDPVAMQLAFPLRGARLIEASAGTGKTFTIATLYVRLVLHHGDNAFARGLTPREILVVTFTDAATRELRDRIRDRLAGAAAAFRGESDASALDPFLEALLAEERDPAVRARQARILEQAAESMDEAAVSTIHAWCYRMLREHAFDSGSLFSQHLETDTSDLLNEAVEDFWRTFTYPMDAEALAHFHTLVGATPNELLGRIAPLLGSVGAETAPETVADLMAPVDAWLAALERCKKPWRDDRAAVEAQFRRLLADGILKKNRYRRPEDQLQALGEWARTPGQQVPVEIGADGTQTEQAKWIEAFSASGMAAQLRSGAAMPDDLHQAFHALDQLLGDPAAQPPRAALLRKAAAWVSQRFEAAQRRRAQLGFQDLLTRLHDALHGPNGDTLAAAIRQAFPVALIDEFQDTDPIQYGLFERIYGLGGADAVAFQEPCAIFLIGDPKQAIYSFRGADIHTYLRARTATGGAQHSLPRNFRSTEALVAAVNHVFEQAERHRPGGAFAFPQDGGSALPFRPVEAQGRREVFHDGGGEAAALTLWCHDPGEVVPQGAYRTHLAGVCATEMVRLLNGGAEGRTGFLDGEDSDWKPLRPGDLAVLVRNRREARAIQDALDDRGVRSVYLSDRDSVLTTPEADDIVRWLQACAEPTSERHVRAALATPTLALTLTELDRLQHDELAWERRLAQFDEYRRWWQRRGVLAMLRRLLHDFDVPGRLLADTGAGGERALTNLLHLGEWLQQAAAEHVGEMALIRHLQTQREAAGGGADEQILRLESDDDRVKVVTVHKSKGLQYPLVFVPFACTFKPVDRGQVPRRIRDARGGSEWVFELDDQTVKQADEERLAEDLRLLYVAMTRAQHACYLGIAPIVRGNARKPELPKSAAGRLLIGTQAPEPGQLREALEGGLGGATERPAGLAIVPAPAMEDTTFRPVDGERTLGSARTPERRAFDGWWIASYSALSHHEATAAAPESTAEDVLLETAHETRTPEPPRTGWHAFPRGPGPGTFLHALLEWAGSGPGWRAVADDPAELDAEVARRCGHRALSQWTGVVQHWLRRIVTASWSLPGADAPLQLGAVARYQTELEFLMEARPLTGQRLDAEVQRHVLPGHVRPAASTARLNGMLKGFIDLVVEHDGRYYVLDYKSNALGDGDDAYTADALQRAVLARRYDLQLVLYTLALHRLLRARLPEYDYDEHMGGGLYLFLRGVEAPGGGLFHERPPRALIETLDGWLAEGPDAQNVLSETAS